jgi:proline dehydrogenase
MDGQMVSFDNTEIAFAYKTDRQLRKARFLFSSMGNRTLVRIGTRITPLAMKLRLPINSLIRNTIFEQFVGGETLDETAVVAKRLAEYGVKVILDYGVEGKTNEESFDRSCNEFIRVIEYAATQPNMPFMSIKITGLARFGLLQKLDAAANRESGYTGQIVESSLDENEKEEWLRVVARVNRIIAVAEASGVGVLVDAEESWIQDPVDALTVQMMAKYNRGRAVVYNTVQLYRHDRLNFLKRSYYHAQDVQFLPAFKIVRGAYMEKERARAEEFGYPSPIQRDKESSNRDFNEAMKFCIENLNSVALIVASHNEESNLLAIQHLKQNSIPVHHHHIHFSQLYGMSDNITFNLAKAGCSVSKYLPFGPIGDVIPYLMRRAQENTSVSGQTGRELGLIEKELKRRKK